MEQIDILLFFVVTGPPMMPSGLVRQHVKPKRRRAMQELMNEPSARYKIPFLTTEPSLEVKYKGDGQVGGGKRLQIGKR